MKFWAGVMILLVSQVMANTATKIKQDIDKLINKTDKTINIGVVIKDLSNNKILYQRNANRYYVPASNLKLYSDAAGLLLLGPDYKFKTRLLTDASEIQNGQLQGNLYLQLSNSPTFSHAKLGKMLGVLKQLNVTTIKGNIILVSAYAKLPAYGPGWMLDDMSYDYGAPLTPVIIDKNSISVTIDPAFKPGTKATIRLDDPSSTVTVTNNVKTLADGAGCRINYRMNDVNELTVSGCIGQSRLARQDFVAVKNPLRYMRGAFNKILQENKVHLDGSIHLGELKSKAKILAVQTSPSLADLMKNTLKPSDNLFADSVFLKVAQQFYKTPVNWKKAGIAVKKILNKYAHVKLSKAVIVDGSGLSRYNLISPMQTVSLLSYLYKQFPIAYEFITALPVAGRDGTLQKRMLASERVDLVRAKTGSMLGVVSLAGFLPSKNGHPLAFAMMSNGIPGSYHSSLSPYRYLEESIAQYLLHLDVKTPLLRLRGKQVKRRLLPYEKRLSTLRAEKENRRLTNRLEFVLRKSLSVQGIGLLRQAHGVALVVNTPTKINKAVLLALAKSIKKYNAWVYLASNNKALRTLAQKSLPASQLVLANSPVTQLKVWRLQS